MSEIEFLTLHGWRAKHVLYAGSLQNNYCLCVFFGCSSLVEQLITTRICPRKPHHFAFTNVPDTSFYPCRSGNNLSVMFLEALFSSFCVCSSCVSVQRDFAIEGTASITLLTTFFSDKLARQFKANYSGNRFRQLTTNVVVTEA